MSLIAEENHWNWQITPELRITTLDKQSLIMIGGQTSLEYKSWYFCGAFYYGISDIKTKLEIEEGEYDGFVLSFPRNLIYGGGSIGQYFINESIIKPHLGLFCGGGVSRAAGQNDTIFILEPRTGIDLQLSPNSKLSGTLSYRIAFFSDWFPNSWISGWNLGLGLSIFSLKK